MTLITLLFLILTTVFGVTLFFGNAPQIGEKSKGARLERIQKSPNYKDGIFVNSVPTTMTNPWKVMRKVGREFFFSDNDREPKIQLNSKPMNLDNFMQVPENEFGVYWLGHSTLLIRFEGKTLLLDPVFGKRASMFSFSGPRRFNYSHIYQLSELPPVDAVILSHDHYDHLDYETITYLKDKVDSFFMPIGVGAHLEKWGVPLENIHELDWWESISFNDNLEFTLTPTRHFSGRGLNDRYKTLWGSWVINGQHNNIYFSGDSGYFDGFKEIGDKYGPFDITFMECGAYNELWSQIHMMPEESVQASKDLQGKIMMPIHWGKFNLALHPWKEPVQRMSKKADELGVKVATPKLGQLMILSKSIPAEHWWEQY